MKPSMPIGALLLAAASLTLTACGGGSGSGAYAGKSVCVDQYATATVTDELVKGIRGGLADAAGKGLKITVQNPNADTATEQTLAQTFLNNGCDVVVPVGTAAAQLMSTAIKDVPVVFAASSTPVDAKLVDSMGRPGGNVTGVADVIDPVPDIDAMRTLMPDLRTVGLVWKLGDPAGESQARQAREHLGKLGVRYIPATITNGSEVTQAAESLAHRVQAIEIPGDTTTLSAIGGLMKVADSAKIPVFGGTSEVVEAGGVLSSTYDYKVVGEHVARLVRAILDGADPATTPVVVPPTAGLDLNLTKLGTLGITVPESLKKSAVTTH
ncbi:ABC transporter substrate-binding protein [Actinomadura chibensis]|uniref:ABC transporter substrate-binding protein n=1 Tax=Actinomadura chibensis TaxID=392828 RepID=A0A5D0NLU7_9ACTN|nr:ABC transporter substrate-binding protein [Actinomadura chibensis]TYB44991.1 ABC transporter substrate-binding protein [Actinomadura chibensis]